MDLDETIPPGRLVFDFTHDWWLDAPTAQVVDVLARPLDYPRGWPQVTAAVPTRGPGGTPAAVLCVRSLLPCSLILTLSPIREDTVGAVLVAALGTDLQGWSSMRVGVVGGRTRVRYRQRVALTAPRLAPWAAPAAPLLRANHAWMMRDGARGLRARLREGAPQPR